MDQHARRGREDQLGRIREGDTASLEPLLVCTRDRLFTGLGASDPTLRSESPAKTGRACISLRFAGAAVKDVVSCCGEISRLNRVFEGSNEPGETKVSLELQDGTMEAA
jgi:hypothetical protein